MAPSLVQVASKAVTSGNLTITLGTDNPAGPSPGPTTAGNCLVALIGSCADTSNGTISGITLGGSADNWAQSAAEGAGGDHAISTGWADPSCAGGQTSVVISQASGSGTVQGLMAYVFEFSGLTGTVDVSLGQSSAGFVSSWTSGTTGATAQASEVAFGITTGASNSRGPGLTGPSSPWTNETLLVVAGTTRDKFMLCGYQILSATGTQSYAGTSSPTTTNDTLVFTLKAAGGGTPHTATASLSVAPSVTATRTRGHSRTGTLAVTPSLAASRTLGHSRTASRPVSPSVAASRTAGRFRTASRPVAPSVTAARTRGHYRTAALSPAPSVTITRQQGHARQAAVTVTPAITATRTASRVRTAALQVIPALRATASRITPGAMVLYAAGRARQLWAAGKARNGSD